MSLKSYIYCFRWISTRISATTSCCHSWLLRWSKNIVYPTAYQWYKSFSLMNCSNEIYSLLSYYFPFSKSNINQQDTQSYTKVNFFQSYALILNQWCDSWYKIQINRPIYVFVSDDQVPGSVSHHRPAVVQDTRNHWGYNGSQRTFSANCKLMQFHSILWGWNWYLNLKMCNVLLIYLFIYLFESDI